MEATHKTSPYRFSLKYALIVAAVPIVYNTFLTVFGLLLEYHGEGMGFLKMYTNLFFLPVVILFAIYTYKKKNAGFLKLKEAFIIGMGIALVSIASMLVYDVLFNTVLAPSFHDSYYEVHGDEILKEFEQISDNPAEEFERHKQMRIKYWTLYEAHTIINIFMGLLFSSIGGFIMRQKRLDK